MKVTRIYNAALFKQVLTKPKLWNAISEDDSGTEDDFNPDLTRMIVLALTTEAGLHGFFIARPLNASVTEVHIAIDPDLWGNAANVELAKRACAWVFENDPRTIKLVASIPNTDHQVLRYAQRVGFQREGVNKASFIRNGEVLDQFYVGLTRPVTRE